VLSPGHQAGLYSMFEDIHRPPADATRSQTNQAAARPNVVRLNYTVPITADFTPPADPAATAANSTNPTGAVVEVAQAPHLPTLDTGTGRYADATRPLPRVKTAYFRAWQPYSQVASAYPAHGAVVAIQFSISYGTSPR